MVFFLPIDFFSSWRIELHVLLAVLVLALLSWIWLFIKSFGSYMNTPIIRNTVAIVSENHKKNLAKDKTFVSVIVPARNEEDNIRKCLLSILKQEYSNFEVIAIDDNSEDRTFKIMKEISLKEVPRKKKLIVISLSTKPDGWMGKTWASQQGYLNSHGEILLFIDADSFFESKFAIRLTVSQMLSEKLDALTGVPYLPLIDFWSKVVMPVWNLYSEVFNRGIADANDPRSKVAFVMGSFFMINREVFENIGTYKSVKDEIQEDKAIGNLLKTSQYRLKMFKIDSLVSALWSRDISSLWHGIRRSVMPALVDNKSRIILHQLLMFTMVALPFFLLPYTAVMLYGRSIYIPPPSFVSVIPNNNTLILSSTAPDSSGEALQFDTRGFNSNYPFVLNPANKGEIYLKNILFWLNLSLCLLVITATGIKSIMKYRLMPLYSVLCFIGGLFLIASYAYSTFPLLIGLGVKPIKWRGRAHFLHSNYNEKNKTI
ncbi:MAG: glycosyltransferase family 2 protein [Thermoproteota archaeon]|nr:glycosyltransferase family 2 protein [Thermoproteota archaeon]